MSKMVEIKYHCSKCNKDFSVPTLVMGTDILTESDYKISERTCVICQESGGTPAGC